LAGVCWLVGCVVLALVVLLACGLIGCFRHISTMFALRMATVAAESPSCASLLASFVRCASVIFVLGCPWLWSARSVLRRLPHRTARHVSLCSP
jgi:hypothetical protein